MLAGIHRLKIPIRQHVKVAFQDGRRCLEARVGRGRGKGQLLAFDVFDGLDTRAGIGDDLHLIPEIAVLRRHDSERSETRAVHGQRIGPGVKTRDVQAARTHRFDLGGIVLDWKEQNVLACLGLQMLKEIGPRGLVDGWVLDGCIREDQRIRVNLVRRIRRYIRNQVAVDVAKACVQIAARTILRRGCRAHGYNRQCCAPSSILKLSVMSSSLFLRHKTPPFLFFVNPDPRPELLRLRYSVRLPSRPSAFFRQSGSPTP